MTDIQKILNADAPLTLASVGDGALPLVLSDIARMSKGRTVYIAPDDAMMQAVADATTYFAPELKTILFPAWDCLPYDRASPTLSISAQRLAALFELQDKPDDRTLVITTVNAVSQRVLTPFRMRQGTLKLAPGTVIDRDELTAILHRQGYVRTDTVADSGEFAIRGNLVDLTPSGLNFGLRLDFFGDEIETLRAFDVSTQRSIKRLDKHLLLPASEALLDEDNIKRFRGNYRTIFGAESTTDPLYQAISEGRRLAGMEHWLPLMEEKMATLFDYLGPDDVITCHAASKAASEQRFEAIADYHANRRDALEGGSGGYRPIESEKLYLLQQEYLNALESHKAHRFSGFDEPESDTTLHFGFGNSRSFAPERARNANVYEAVTGHIASNNRKAIIASYSAGARDRLAGLLQEHGLARPVITDGWQEAQGLAANHDAALTVLPLENGFVTDTLELLTEQDILGDRLIKRRRRKKDAEAFLSELSAMSEGDLVVHMEHGIGRYDGLMSIPVGKSPHDCVALTYAGGDKLYVPVENIDVLSRYGSESDGAALDKLGGEAWQRRKSKMKERIRAIAGELLKTAAARALNAAERATIEPNLYASFADRFPYQETEDQERVIGEVLDDLSSGKPMDRLVCGDVGFGKTEVAMRAAFVAAMSGMQVAIIAPTTLLARQHYSNFVERFKGFPLNIGRLSRLVPVAEAKRTKEGMADGTIDICIGTHALLAKTISFKHLGLVIVDEEQRFGVVHKERLKALKNNVHMLTLTATPIPRTLQMAMTGLRELSVIQTPPVDRLAIRTYVMPWDQMVIREALLREHYRGGQSFFVVPRISDMAEIQDFLKAYVPEIKVVSAHGQMTPTEVEERMSAFYDRKFDVLLSTTIVESGLDIPSANTLIIHRADRFGLAQLYQLRGRVGRSKTRAYAYFTVPENRVLTETADKRLKVLGDLDSLGAGFQLASHDLDIRGAGNLVGDEQSGHIREVGFELYQSLLEDAIIEAKAGQAGLKQHTETFSPQISVDAPIMIPEDYVPDLAVRMALYRRMNDLLDKGAIEGFAAEMIDRFGDLPDATANLLKIIEIKQNAIVASVSKIDVGPRGALVTFHKDHFPHPEGLLRYVDRLNGVAKLRPDMKLMINRAWNDPKSRLNGLIQLSKGLASIILKQK
ncbi:transcription-repair coupling factor [Sphingorhabdus sp. Alg239-R122]|uniref:transcription-repair coupling factor n=1 Tax=Sphingorhabdus sp. Alg239-R122 TaxID=2305989 RepID=UPI0013D98E85|nr:transcription-repair coupling factor [Sphingorhabdus sp. Alg239-R122]